jgi:pimeloyl-ACP methyl ester carboxylesterase
VTDELRPTGVGLDLEVIDKGFADTGYRCLALSIRGHGRSLSSKPLRTCSLADYIDDVESVATSLPSRPVVIGHSLGGL